MAIMTMNTALGDGQRPTDIIVDYVRNEICIVCEFPDPGPQNRDNPGPELATLRQNVLDALNHSLVAALPTAPRSYVHTDPAPDRPSLLDQVEQTRMTPIQLQRAFSAGANMLQPLSRNLGRLGSSVLLRRHSASATALLFYDVAQDGLPPEPDRRLIEQLERVRELTNLVNWDLIGPLRREFVPEGAQFAILAAHPVWLKTATQGDGGSPGSRPEPEIAANWVLRCANQAVEAKLAGTDEANVLVALLDTSPTGDQIKGAATRYDPKNWLLDRLAGEIGTRFHVDRDEASDLTAAYNDAHLDRLLPLWRDAQPPDGASHDPYLMPDHGLFAAGIVRQFAPKAGIRLIRALDDHGLGDMLFVAHALAELPLRVPAGPNQRLIVNLSLGADIPAGADAVEVSYPTAYDQLLQLLGPALLADFETELEALATSGNALAVLAENVLTMVRRSHLGLADVVGWLTDADGAVAVGALAHRALVVAASGNDHEDEQPIKEPRLPAHYENVFSVAATSIDRSASKFSNRGDEKSLQDGIATFGGDATRTASTDLPIIQGGDVGIVSVFSAETVPQPPSAPVTNATGWVRWAGTSFSTPIISAVAAKVWGYMPGATPEAVMEEVRLLTTGFPVVPPAAIDPVLMAPILPIEQVQVP
jgi:subtilisin family serine protease